MSMGMRDDITSSCCGGERRGRVERGIRSRDFLFISFFSFLLLVEETGLLC